MIVELLTAVLFIIEAKLEYFVIELKDPNKPNYRELNKKEHWWSAVFAIALCLSLSLGNFLLFPSLLLSRRLFFDYFLKVFRKREIKKIEGDGPVDSFVRKIFGKNGGFFEIATLLIIKIIYIYFIIIK